MNTTIHPLVCLILNLRNVLARWASDVSPDDSGEVAADSYATAYDAFEGSNFRMFGAFGNPGADDDSVDSLTGAKGFHPLSGEAIGLQSRGNDTLTENDGRGFDASNWNSYQSSAEGLTDTTEMSDDNLWLDRDFEKEASESIPEGATEEDIEDIMAGAYTLGRWAHVADGHLAEMASIDAMLASPVGAPGPLPGEMEASKESRERYAAEIARNLDKMRDMYRNAKRRNDARKMATIEATAKAYKRRIRSEYGKACRNLGPGPDSKRWRFLPLTKAHLETLGI